MKVRYKKLSPDAKAPTYATLGAGCFDLAAAEATVLAPGIRQTVGTGLVFEVPDDHVMLLFSRSGHAAKSGVRLQNCVGVIDSDYRGEVKVMLTGDAGGSALHIKPGDRIAQALIMPIQRISFDEAPDLSETARDAAGFGSTGA